MGVAVVIALLCGTDFNRTVPGIAATTACRSIAQYGSVEAVLRMSEPRYAPPDQLQMDAYLAELEEARSIFLHPPRVEQFAHRDRPPLRPSRERDRAHHHPGCGADLPAAAP